MILFIVDSLAIALCNDVIDMCLCWPSSFDFCIAYIFVPLSQVINAMSMCANGQMLYSVREDIILRLTTEINNLTEHVQGGCIQYR